MYESPLSRIYEEIQTKIIEHEENQIVQAVQNCGISVDKKELTKALMYDRQQYEKGYADAKAEMGWIPCSERLPEENMWTICQNNAGAMMIGKYDIEFGWMFPAYFDGIVAWMPLPEPYKGDADE